MTENRVVVPPDAFIRVTGQVWKLVLGTIVLPFIVVGIVLWTLDSALTGPTAELLKLLAIVLGALALIVFLLASVSCPRCNKRLFWAVFTAPDSSDAISKFLGRRDCPACGYTPARE